MYIDPDRLTRDQERRVDAWLVANGCRHYVSLDHPVIVKGRRAHYVALCRRDQRSTRRLRVTPEGNLIPLGERSVRITVPLASYVTIGPGDRLNN